ncbi:MAG: tetratricopeptide repeat protein [Oscillospiraceae bacterium]|nr:tetratricopeptide repeat protein [Oscillospiraceae bacterium]
MEILSLGEKIKKCRKEMNMILKDLAGERITPGQISLIESGKSKPSMDLLHYLATNLNTTVEYLMESEETQAEKISKYYRNIAEALIYNQKYDEVFEYLQKASTIVKKYNIALEAAYINFLFGKIYYLKNNYEEAADMFLECVSVFLTNGKYEDLINTFMYLGIIKLNLKYYHIALSYFHQAEFIYNNNDINDETYIKRIYYYIAKCFDSLGKKEKAIFYLNELKNKQKDINDKRSYAKTLLQLAKELEEKGEFEKALKLSDKFKKIYNDLYNYEINCETENNLGKIYFKHRNFEDSIEHFQIVKDLKLNNKDSNIADIYLDLCEYYLYKRDIKEFEEYFNKAKLYINNNMKNKIKYFILSYKKNLLEENLQIAEESLIRALDCAKQNSLSKEIIYISFLLGKFYIDNNEAEKARGFLNSGIDSLNNAKSIV